MIAGHVRDVIMLHNLSNGHYQTQTHLLIYSLHPLFIHSHRFYHPNHLIHSLALLSLQRIITAYSGYVKSGMPYSLKVVEDVNKSGLTLGLEIIFVKIVKNQLHSFTRITTCIQGQGVLTSHHSLNWRRCSFHLYMH